jgi:hypothetical protein
MNKWSPMSRPVTAGEMATTFRCTSGDINRILARHQIGPAVRIGRLRLYGPPQVRAVYQLLPDSIFSRLPEANAASA